MIAAVEFMLDNAPGDDEQMNDISFAEECPACGAHELVFEDGQLVDLNGNPHICGEQ